MRIACGFILLSVIACLDVNVAPAQTHSSPGQVTLSSDDVGTTIDLTSTKWLFKPGYALADGERPEQGDSTAGYVPVPVPQMLSRIQWWLDDSEDYKKWEQARLDALGIDPEKIEDGWYRLAFDVPKDWPADRHLWVEFDGVAMQCKSYCNGALLGEHKGMFSRFGYDLSPHLKPGETNVLAVWVSMEKIPPTEGNLGEAVTVNLSAAKVISMSKGMFGPLTPNQDNRAYDLIGIWQPVKLVVRGAGKIEDVWFQPSLAGAKVQVTLGQRGGAVKAVLTEAATGEKLAETIGGVASAANATDVVHLNFDGLKPKLWTPNEPHLYRLDVTLDEQPDGSYSDRWSHDVGFRTFEVKGNQFYLNGHPYWLRGGNQLPYGKNPWDPKLARTLIQFLHDGNVRFTRTHATPWNEAWLTAADEIGLAVSIEGIRPWAFAGRSDQIGRELLPPPDIFQHWLMENADVVKRCRNHPSVFIFTVGNEMLLRDKENMKKWEMLSEVTKQTRQLAPDHPIVVSSDYVRDPEFYEKKLKPAGIDDGDIDDMHRYNGWYGDSTFVVDSKFKKELADNQRERPLMGQEFATGYPDLDTGLPVLRYTRDLLTPQAWVGVYAYPGNDPSIWLAEHARVTKRWAERLRFQRSDRTAGFALFSTECWFRHSFLPEATPYPVYDAVKQAFAPVGLALETSQRRFWAGESLKQRILVTNDDEQFRDLSGLVLHMELIDPATGEAIAVGRAQPVSGLQYYQTKAWEYEVQLPEVKEPRRALILRTILNCQSTGQTSHTDDPVELFRRPPRPMGRPISVVFIDKGESLEGLKAGGEARKKIEAGATAIVFSPSAEIVKLFPDDLLDVKGGAEKPDVVEYADWTPARGTKLAENLHPMDVKWWARQGDERTFIANGSHRLNPAGGARELMRYIPPHGYISEEKVPEQYRAVLSEIRLGKGRLWICDLDLDASAAIDPAAALVRDNLYQAAADPHSTDRLAGMPTHQEMLKGELPR